jgi:glycine/D-amino acid oxidase-like deaminating enzyme
MFLKKGAEFDIAISGAGAAGLMLAQKFSRLGYRTALIEKEREIAGGPSTKNEGWLHPGTLHAVLVNDSQKATEVAQRCRYGFDQIKAYAPEAIEDNIDQTLALVKTPGKASFAEERWQRAGVPYRLITKDHMRVVAPQLDLDAIHAGYQVLDLSLNTRILYQKLLTDSIRAGTTVFTQAQLLPEDERKAVLQFTNGRRLPITANRFIHVTGNSIGDSYKLVTGETLPVRIFKAHMVIAPRLVGPNAFYLESGEAALMNHREKSMVGQHEDAMLVEGTPDFDVVQERANMVYEATRRLIPGVESVRGQVKYIACLKPDVSLGQRSTGEQIFRSPGGTHIFGLPGKMTQTPHFADMLVQDIFEESSPSGIRIAQRPIDKDKKIRN